MQKNNTKVASISTFLVKKIMHNNSIIWKKLQEIAGNSFRP